MGLHPGDGDQENRKPTIEGRKEGTREKMRGFMSFGVHGLHPGDGDQENRKPTIEGLKENIR
jgi:hypothetical protein